MPSTPSTTTPIEAYKALVKSGHISADPCQLDAMKRLQSLQEQLAEYGQQMGQTGWMSRLSFMSKKRPPPRGLYLWGGVGRGKSMLMDLFFEHAGIEESQRVHFHGFMQEVQKRLHSFRQAQLAGDVSKDTDPIKALAKVIVSKAWLLCFDEFQVSDIGDAMILGRLFEAMFNLGAIVVTTSNRPPQDLYKDGLQRDLFLPFIGLIEEKLSIIELDHGIDYRFQKLRSMDTYLYPTSLETETKLLEDFKELTLGHDYSHHAKIPSANLEVNGRIITISCAVEGIASVTFDELCKQTYGPGDYLAIAGRFNTLILQSIPRLGPENRDAAKRFITLIDALYEAKVNLICSAQAPAHELYTSGDGSFEFERTVSRLMEMQTPEYMELEHISA